MKNVLFFFFLWTFSPEYPNVVCGSVWRHHRDTAAALLKLTLILGARGSHEVRLGGLSVVVRR